MCRRPSNGTAACGAVLAFVAAGAATASLAAPPSRVAIQYDISYNGAVVAEATEVLEHEGTSYSIQSLARGKGLFAVLHRGDRARSSRGRITSSGLRPEEYRDQRGDRSPEAARFDWDRHVVVLERDGRTRSLPVANDMQDRLSFVWGLAFAPSVKGEVSATIVDGRGTTLYRYRVAGNEDLKTPAGEFRALRLVKQKDAVDERATEVWLAAGRNYVPVRILVVEKDGTRVDQVATRISP